VVAGTSRLHDAVRESSRSACSRLQVDPELRDLIHHDRTDSLEESIFQVVARLVAGSSCRCVSMFQNVGLPEIELPRCPSRPWYRNERFATNAVVTLWMSRERSV
jgi:hypothetical protein